MADSTHFSLFQHKFLTGDNPLLSVDDEFLSKHTKVLLSSDASDRIWKVVLDGNRLVGGWKEFAAANNFRDGDSLVFRHDGDENFHVSVSSRSDSKDTTHASSSDLDTEDDVDTEDLRTTDDGEDDWNEDNIENISVKKKTKLDAECSSDQSGFITACVTPYSLLRDRLDLARDFNPISFGEDNKPLELDLVNEQGSTWTLRLAKNRSSGVFYIRHGWRNFCLANELSQGDKCKFKLVENGERHVFLLCPQESGNGCREECPKAVAVKNLSVGGCSKEKKMSDVVSKGKEKKTLSAFLTVKFTPNRYKTGQLYISSEFIKENGIGKPGKIILLDKHGRKWSTSLLKTGCEGRGNEWFYLRRGWREMCEANGVKVNDSFKLELIWEDANPMFKFCSKITNDGKGICRTRKRIPCETSLEPKIVDKTPSKSVSRRPDHQEVEKRGVTRVSNQTNTHSRKLQRTQPKSCSVSDQVTNVKQCILDTLKTVRQVRLELKTREQNLQASLLEIDALGEKILGISNTLV